MYVGIDYHRRYSVATKVNEKGQVLEQVRFNNDPESLARFAAGLPAGSKVALEATGHWYYFYEQMESRCPDIVLAHPLKTRAIAEARIKTDKVDSAILAHLLRTDLLPTSYIPPREVRDDRELLRFRASLIELRTSIKNKVRALLSKNGIALPYADVFGKKAMASLRGLELRDCYRRELAGYLAVAESLKTQVRTVEEAIAERVAVHPEALLLTGIPGIGDFSALLIVSEIGDIKRFPSARKLCSFAGLVPSVHSSGGKTRHGSLTRQGSKWLRWILVELSPHFARGCPRLQAHYDRVAFKHGAPTARVAVAREMLKIIFYVLRDRRPYYRG